MEISAPLGRSLDDLHQKLVDAMADIMIGGAEFAENLAREHEAAVDFDTAQYACLQLAAFYRAAAVNLERMVIPCSTATAIPPSRSFSATEALKGSWN